MEALHVSTGMPWFWTIVSATLLTRVILFPFTVRSMRSTAALAPHQPEINRLREKMQQAQATKDMLLLQQVALQQRGIYEKAGVSMGSMASTPPAGSRGPRPGLPRLGRNGSMCMAVPMPCPPYSATMP